MITALALAAAVHAPVQTPDLAPGTRYDPDIPTLEQVAGHDFGDAITPPANVIRYIEALAETAPERTHLAAGTDGEIGVLVEGSRVFRPITLDAGANVGRYADLDSLVLGGIVWEESRPQLANKAFLIHQPVGRGQLVAFAEDPNYRAYAEATQLLFMNAVLLGPGR
ncbi:MAG: hypothetical protein OXQ94_06770 [Gemmatimonadota bacterium]|nr:hypothetical protein [Gemmatimonadota bacterium]MDE2871377.1 hypothetical protein [Gemmatimonadota bacterium]